MFRGELTVGPVLVAPALAFSFAGEGCAAGLLAAVEEGAGLLAVVEEGAGLLG